MRTCLTILVTAWCVGTVVADDGPKKAKDANDAVFEKLRAKLADRSDYFDSALFALEYWYCGFNRWHERVIVKTTGGRNAEIILLRASPPGCAYFSLAFLVTDKGVVDWVSCRTLSVGHINHQLLLEDVDGDGNLDVSFRGRGGPHRKAGDDRTWYYAYAITDHGFKSLLPRTDLDLKIKSVCENSSKEGIKIEVQGLPDTVRERRIYECLVIVTNTSSKEVQLDGDGKNGPNWWDLWWDLAASDKGFHWWPCRCVPSGNADVPALLRPGESVVQAARFYLEVQDNSDEVTLRWRAIK